MWGKKGNLHEKNYSVETKKTKGTNQIDDAFFRSGKQLEPFLEDQNQIQSISGTVVFGGFTNENNTNVSRTIPVINYFDHDMSYSELSFPKKRLLPMV